MKRSYITINACAGLVTGETFTAIRQQLERLGFGSIHIAVSASDEPPARLLPETVLLIACSEFGVSEADVRSRSREADYALVRHAYCDLAVSYTCCTLQQVADRIGRSHSTAIHSVRMSRDLLEVGHQPYVAAYGRVKGRILALIQDNNNKHGI